MNDEMLSLLTGIPLRQILTYNPLQKQLIIAMAKKNPKWDLFQDNLNKHSMRLSGQSMEGLGYTPGLQGWSKAYTSNYKFEKPQPRYTPRLVTELENLEEIELMKKLNPTYKYEYFASTKDPNRVGVKVTDPYTGEIAEYGASYIDMYGNEIKNPNWEYMGKGGLGEGLSWRKVAGNMRVNGKQVDNSNKPIHSSATSYPVVQLKQVEEKVKLQSRNTPSSVTATINREVSKYPGNKNGYIANRALGSDAFLNFMENLGKSIKQGASATLDWLKGPGEILTSTPSYGRRNIMTEGMLKFQNIFGNAYHGRGTYGGGKFGGGGAGSTFYERPEYETIEEKKRLLIPITKSWNRDEAFAQARKEGKKTFLFNGKEYTTEMGTGPASAAHDVETKITGVIPVEYNKKRKVKKED